MAKHAEQLRYAHEANSQAFHFLFIYSKDKEQLKKTTGGSCKWWTHRTIVRTAALSHRLYPFRQKKINVWEQPGLLFVEQKARPGLISCCPSKLWLARVHTSNYRCKQFAGEALEYRVCVWLRPLRSQPGLGTLWCLSPLRMWWQEVFQKMDDGGLSWMPFLGLWSFGEELRANIWSLGGSQGAKMSSARYACFLWHLTFSGSSFAILNIYFRHLNLASALTRKPGCRAVTTHGPKINFFNFHLHLKKLFKSWWFVGICIKQTCFLTSGVLDLSPRASLQQYFIWMLILKNCSLLPFWYCY